MMAMAFLLRVVCLTFLNCCEASQQTLALNKEQCRSLSKAMDSGADRMSQVLLSPVVKFLVQAGGTVCTVHWPQQGMCRGKWALPRMKSHPAVEVDCKYHKERNVCKCTALGHVLDNSLVQSDSAMFLSGDVAYDRPVIPIAAVTVPKSVMRSHNKKDTKQTLYVVE